MREVGNNYHDMVVHGINHDARWIIQSMGNRFEVDDLVNGTNHSMVPIMVRGGLGNNMIGLFS